MIFSLQQRVYRQWLLIGGGSLFFLGLLLIVIQDESILSDSLMVVGGGAVLLVVRAIQAETESRRFEKERVLFTRDGWKVPSQEEVTEQAWDIPQHFTEQTNIQARPPAFLASKTIQEHAVQIIRRTWFSGSGKNEATQEVIEFHIQLRHILSGSVRIVPDDTGMLWDIRRSWVAGDERMESNEFNRQSWLLAEPDKLAYQVFSPDMMSDWMDEGKIRPIIHVEHDRLLLVYDNETEQQDGWYAALLPKVMGWVERVEASGALVKKT